MVAPAEEIRGHRRHGERSAPSREVAFSHKSPCLSTQRGRPTPELDARANHLASPARADVQRQCSSRDVWGSPTHSFTLQIWKSWISPVGGQDAQIAPHQQFVQSEWLHEDNKEVRGWSDSQLAARESTRVFSLTSFVRKRYLVEPARRAG